ncbi:MAG TPA: HDOD domain-containing protein [Dissulfurispiraceae bacterium]|nr:HDOD domain-containing protein [Dissulfurispiraceae bacterium]
MTVFDKIEELRTLPTLPVNLSRLISVLNDENASLRELEEIIKRDQAVTARIITVANSAAFGYAGFINSIEQAILLLGIDLVRSLSVGISIFQSFPLPPALLKHLWAHAYSAATVSNLLARKIRHADRNVCFLGGLLHDIGRLVLLTIFPRDYSITQDAESIIESEKERFLCTHAEAGSHFLKALNVPAEITDSMLYHHSIDIGSPHREVIACTYFSEGLLQILGTPFVSDSLWTDEHQNLFEAYGLTVSDVEELAAMLKSQESEVMTFFEL